MQIKLSQLLQMMFNVKVQSNQISKFFEIVNYVERSPKQSVINFIN